MLFLSEYCHHGTVKIIRAATRKVNYTELYVKTPESTRLKKNKNFRLTAYLVAPERVVYYHEKRIKGQAISLSSHEPVTCLPSNYMSAPQSHWMPIISNLFS
jgi:hypothetical protein